MNRELQSYIRNELETVVHAVGKAGGPHLIRDILNKEFQETYPECVCSIQMRKKHSTRDLDADSRSSSDDITDRIIEHLKVIEGLLAQIKRE
ncbi:hypothetical protein G6F42_026166 [Rhizopus arrhizus]|nr:hypothetical protein G6F42_026166 [Rhizopus arrhizus]